MALSIIKARINKREYKHITNFVRDFALVCATSPCSPLPSGATRLTNRH